MSIITPGGSGIALRNGLRDGHLAFRMNNSTTNYITKRATKNFPQRPEGLLANLRSVYVYHLELQHNVFFSVKGGNTKLVFKKL